MADYKIRTSDDMDQRIRTFQAKKGMELGEVVRLALSILFLVDDETAAGAEIRILKAGDKPRKIVLPEKA